MMTVTKYWESVSNKTEILFSVLAKKAPSIFILDNGITYKIDDGRMKKIYPCSKNQTEKTNILEGNEDMSM